jgi:prevent-host-death family protein
VRTISARQANQQFSSLLSGVENGEEFVITKHGKAVALITWYQPTKLTREREEAIERAVKIMTRGMPVSLIQTFLAQ